MLVFVLVYEYKSIMNDLLVSGDLLVNYLLLSM